MSNGSYIGTELIMTLIFAAALNYTAMRLLGLSAEEPFMVRARATLHRLGMSAQRVATFVYFSAHLLPDRRRSSSTLLGQDVAVYFECLQLGRHESNPCRTSSAARVDTRTPLAILDSHAHSLFPFRFLVWQSENF